MHKKEDVLASLLEKRLGVQVIVPAGIDTDQLGTFSGERERKGTPLETARAKCRLAMDASGSSLAVASEGSFGAHPALWFAQANEEWVMLRDEEKNLEITGRALSLETNFAGAYVHTVEELYRFARKAGFPAHRLILRESPDSLALLHKGIGSWQELLQLYRKIKKQAGRVYAETDMRAMYNPGRQRVIAKACQDLVARVRSRCPACKAPGFGRTKALQGLACKACKRPTQSVKGWLWVCACCNHQLERMRHDKQAEEPMYCNFCNP